MARPTAGKTQANSAAVAGRYGSYATLSSITCRIGMRLLKLAPILLAGSALAWPQTVPLKSVGSVLERYQQALGGVDAIRKVESGTWRGEIEESGTKG